MENSTELTDEELMTGLADGRSSCLGELYIRHTRAIRAALYRWMPEMTRADIDDVTQDIFMALGKTATNYRGESSFKTWLYQIALRTVSNWRRKTWVRRRFLRDRREPVAMALRENAHSPDSRAALRQVVEHMFSKLSYDQRQALWLHFVEGFDGDEIAQMMHVRRSTIYTRLHRARQALVTSIHADLWKALLSEGGQ
ncbi:MAG: RNA polymerase sigma factor [Myxococcota bacterium]|nr:RNA polymerase sigma factor [Myxococcota bacterium]